MFATRDDHVEPESVECSIMYPVIVVPPLFAGAVQDKLICDEDTVVAASPVGGEDIVVVPPEEYAFTSTAMSSHISPLLAVHLQVTEPAVVCTAELDAPVIALGMCVFHCGVQVGEPSVTPP